MSVIWGKSVLTFSFRLFYPFLPVSGAIAGHRIFNNCGQQVSLKPTGMTCRNKIEFSYDIITEYRCQLLCLFSDRETSICFSLSLWMTVCVLVGCGREMTELCVYVNILLEDKHLGKRWFPLLFIF